MGSPMKLAAGVGLGVIASGLGYAALMSVPLALPVVVLGTAAGAYELDVVDDSTSVGRGMVYGAVGGAALYTLMHSRYGLGAGSAGFGGEPAKQFRLKVRDRMRVAAARL